MVRFYSRPTMFQPAQYKRKPTEVTNKKPVASDSRYIISTLEGEMAYCNKHLGTKFNVFKFRQCWHCLQEEQNEAQ